MDRFVTSLPQGGKQSLPSTIRIQSYQSSPPRFSEVLGSSRVHSKPQNVYCSKRKVGNYILNGATFKAAAKWLQKVQKDEQFHKFLADYAIK